MPFDSNRALTSRGFGFAIAALIFGLDRLTKWLIETRVGFFDTYKIIPGFFDIVRSANRGVAFGIFNDSNSEWRTKLLILGTVAACVAVSAMLWKAERLDRSALWGLALILGGAAGNLFDRTVFGRVTDFLLLYIGSYQWPTFNIADSAIVIGSGLLILDQLRGKRRQTAHVS
ncbi:MAG TPA: signal peptidase II [Bryobacteraceae bacterium]|nr:signal peptidase II [Bryobacteraceae bacterium]